MKSECPSTASATQVAEEIINAVYKGFLGRLPDKAGLAYWTGLLATQSDISTVVNTIMASDEYKGQQTSEKAAIRVRPHVAAWARSYLEQPLVIVDVGAQELVGEEHVYSSIRAFDLPHKTIGFEPLQHRIDEARLHMKDNNVLLFPVFIGDGSICTFNINKPDSTSSLLPFNTDLTSRLVELSCLHTERTEKVVTETLDIVLAGEAVIDFLKLDIQGFELRALQSAPKVLQRTNVVHCEVSFAEIYQGQALFSEVERFMKESGFTFYDFSHLCRYAYHGSYTDSRDRLGWGDAVFLRDSGDMSPRDILAQSLIALFVYDKFSLAQSLANRYDLLTGGSLSPLLHSECV